MRVLRPSKADLIVAAVTMILTLGGTAAGAVGVESYRPLWPWGYLLLFVASAVVAWQRSFTVWVLGITVAAVALYYPLGFPEGLVVLPLLVALFASARQGRRIAAIVGAVAAAMVALGAIVVKLQGAPNPADMVAYAATLALVVALGELARARAERLAGQRRRAVDEERLRIARELHDVLAHQLSLINVQASAALHRRDSDQAFEALGQIKDASRATLRELRVVLGALRHGEENRAPMPGLDRVDELVARTVAAGLPVELRIKGSVYPLSAEVDLAAYRIVQEALTNTLRHADAAHAIVTLRYLEKNLEVQVDDDGCGVPLGQSADGHGLRGMKERARGVGGTLITRAGVRNGFQVRAILPVGPGESE